MRRFMFAMLVCALALTTNGCGNGDGKLRTAGRLLKGGDEFIPDEGVYIQITFVPIRADGKPPNRHYYADVDQETGTFRPAGADKRGMPAGRYRVAVELMERKADLLNGRFDQENSPFVVDVDRDTEEIVIDLEKPPLYAPPPLAAQR